MATRSARGRGWRKRDTAIGSKRKATAAVQCVAGRKAADAPDLQTRTPAAAGAHLATPYLDCTGCGRGHTLAGPPVGGHSARDGARARPDHQQPSVAARVPGFRAPSRVSLGPVTMMQGSNKDIAVAREHLPATARSGEPASRTHAVDWQARKAPLGWALHRCGK